MPQLLERINFPKVTTILAITLVVAIGACGLTAVTSSGGSSGFSGTLALIELAAIVLSFAGLVLILILWIIAAILGQTGHRDLEP